MKRLVIILSALALMLPVVLVAQGSEDLAHAAAEEAREEVEHAAAPEHEAAESHDTKTYFGIPEWILQAINFVLFFGILFYLLKKPVGAMLENRRQRINHDLEQAEERQKKADQLAHDIQARLDQIEGEVSTILARAREEGERQKKEILAAAETEAKKILTSARNEVDVRVKSARQELTAYAGELAAARARQLVETNLTDADRRKLFEESVAELSGRKS